MRTLLAVLLLATPVAGQVCTGDVDSDGSVTVADVIAVVNQALDNCGQPTPTPAADCTFAPGTRTCSWPTGTAWRTTGGTCPDVPSSLTVSDDTVTIRLPQTTLIASVTGDTHATIIAYIGEDGFRKRDGGLVTLDNNGHGTVLNLRMNYHDIRDGCGVMNFYSGYPPF